MVVRKAELEKEGPGKEAGPRGRPQRPHCPGGVRRLCSFPSINDVLLGGGGGGVPGGLKELGRLEKGFGVGGHAQARFDQIPVFGKRNSSSRPVLKKETLYELLNCVVCVCARACMLQILLSGQSGEKFTQDNKFPFRNFFFVCFFERICCYLYCSCDRQTNFRFENLSLIVHLKQFTWANLASLD